MSRLLKYLQYFVVVAFFHAFFYLPVLFVFFVDQNGIIGQLVAFGIGAPSVVVMPILARRYIEKSQYMPDSSFWAVLPVLAFALPLQAETIMTMAVNFAPEIKGGVTRGLGGISLVFIQLAYICSIANLYEKEKKIPPEHRWFRRSAVNESSIGSFTGWGKRSVLRYRFGLILIVAVCALVFAAPDLTYKLVIEKNSNFIPFSDFREIALDYRVSSMDIEYGEKSALVFIVNENNPVSGLTSEQLRAIFSGRIKNWKDVGGIDAQIIVFHEDSKGSRVYKYMQTEFMQNEKMKIPRLTIYDTYENAVYRNFDNAIGFTSWEKYVEAKIDIKALSVDGILPDEGAVADGQYPYVMAR
jgi:hypothetical protein